MQYGRYRSEEEGVWAESAPASAIRIPEGRYACIRLIRIERQIFIRLFMIQFEEGPVTFGIRDIDAYLPDVIPCGKWD